MPWISGNPTSQPASRWKESRGVVLVVQPLRHSPRVTSPTISVTHALSPASLTHEHRVNGPTLAQTHVLSPHSLSHAHSVTEPQLWTPHLLIPDSLRHGGSSTEPSLHITHLLTPDNLRHSHALTNPSVYDPNGPIPVYPDDLRLEHRIYDPSLVQTHILSPEDIAHVLRINPPAPVVEPTPQKHTYWVRARYAHQAQEKPDQPDNSWDPTTMGQQTPWWTWPEYSGGGFPSNWWGFGTLGPNLIPNPYALPGVLSTDIEIPDLFVWPDAYYSDGYFGGSWGYGIARYTAETAFTTDAGSFQPSRLAWELAKLENGEYVPWPDVIGSMSSNSVGLLSEIPSSLMLKMSPYNFPDPYWQDFRLYPVEMLSSDNSHSPRWPTVTPGQTLGVKVQVVQGNWSYQPPLGVDGQQFAVGIDWYRYPNMVDEFSVVKIGSTQAPWADLQAPGGVTLHGVYEESDNSGGTYLDNVEAVPPSNPAVAPSGVFTAPAGAELARPFVQASTDGSFYYYTSFYFGEVIG